MNTLSVVTFIMAGQLHISSDKIKPESHLIRDLGVDSLDMVAVAAACRDELGVELPDRSIYEMPTVADVVKFIDDHR